jgi:transcriptional regulator with XRE-family HTH domain
MTPQTCRAARSLVGLSQAQLGNRAGVTMLTVRNYESEKTEPSYRTWRAIRTALEKSGIIFIDDDEAGGPGVRLKKARGAK